MNPNDLAPLVVPILVTALANGALWLAKWLFGRRKEQVEEDVTFAGQWEKLANERRAEAEEVKKERAELKARIKALEDHASDYDIVTKAKLTLEARGAALETMQYQLLEAFEYLAGEVSASHAEAVKVAKKIAAGELRRGQIPPAPPKNSS